MTTPFVVNASAGWDQTDAPLQYMVSYVLPPAPNATAEPPVALTGWRTSPILSLFLPGGGVNNTLTLLVSVMVRPRPSATPPAAQAHSDSAWCWKCRHTVSEYPPLHGRALFFPLFTHSAEFLWRRDAPARRD